MKPKKFFASVPEVKKIDEKARTIEHIISTGSEDRDSDTINPKGWILDEYLKNPVVLFGHRHDKPPIARAVKLKATEKGLEALTQFPPKGISQLADTVFEMNRLGYLRSWSVGFDPVKFSMLEDGGIAFEEQKLLEYSSVPVPANPEAVNLAVSKGIMTDKMLELFEWNKGGVVQGHSHGGATADGLYMTPLCSEHELSPNLRESIAKLLTEDELVELDISPEKLQSCFDNGIAALKISGADHARFLRPGKIIRA
jgi:HK97 family phage prohead protease